MSDLNKTTEKKTSERQGIAAQLFATKDQSDVKELLMATFGSTEEDYQKIGSAKDIEELLKKR